MIQPAFYSNIASSFGFDLQCDCISSQKQKKKAFSLELCFKSNWTSAQLPGQEHQIRGVSQLPSKTSSHGREGTLRSQVFKKIFSPDLCTHSGYNACKKCPCPVVTLINTLQNNVYSYYAFHPIINSNNRYSINYSFFRVFRYFFSWSIRC